MTSGLSQMMCDTQNNYAEAGPQLPGDHHADAASQTATVTGDSASTSGQVSRVNQIAAAAGGSPLLYAYLRDPLLGVLADVVTDLENVRIANANRVRILTSTGIDKDGGERGHGLSIDHPEVAKLALTVDAITAAEADAVKNLQRSMRKHPLGPWQKMQKGVGEKQCARLLAAIGDPFWNDLHDRPRTVSELWAYCGLHVSNGAAPRRQRGQKSNWSEEARKRVWVIASAMPKFPGGRYEQLYRDGRAKYVEALHPAECVRCGPSGKPAQPGSPLSAGHQNARAIRLVGKEILKDLWIEARRLHSERAAEIDAQ